MKKLTTIKRIKHPAVKLSLKLSGREAEKLLSLFVEFHAAYQENNGNRRYEGESIYDQLYQHISVQTDHYVLRMQDLIARRNRYAKNPDDFENYKNSLENDRREKMAWHGECWDNWAHKEKRNKKLNREQYIAREMKHWRSYDKEMPFLLGETDELPARHE